METGWALWATDYFDRDAQDSCEARGQDLEEGLTLLWTKLLEEGLFDDGKPTFTWFRLQVEGAGAWISVDREPLENPELGKLRAWRTPAFLQRLARAHLAQPGHRADAIVAAAREANTPEELWARLEPG